MKIIYHEVLTTKSFVVAMNPPSLVHPIRNRTWLGVAPPRVEGLSSSCYLSHLEREEIEGCQA